MCSCLYWEDGKDQTKYADFVADEGVLKHLANEHVLVLTGSSLIHRDDVLEIVTPYVTIFARMSPQQKGDVIRYTKQKGEYCLMCGDGTNDVAALKQAHIGVSIMSNVDLEDKIASAEKRLLSNEDEEEEKESPLLQVFLSGCLLCRWLIRKLVIVEQRLILNVIPLRNS